jgi:hypothetical protein
MPTNDNVVPIGAVSGDGKVDILIPVVEHPATPPNVKRIGEDKAKYRRDIMIKGAMRRTGDFR